MKTIKTVDRAVAQITEPMATPDQKVAAGTTHLVAIKACPDLVHAPEVGAAAATWETENTNLAQCNQKVRDTELAAEQARTDRASCERRWNGRADATTTAITIRADGSKDVVKNYGMGVGGRTPSPLETVPEKLRGVRSKTPGNATCQWQTHKGNHGYMVQTATDPADPATYSAPAHSTKGKFVVPDLTPGSTLHVRVAALDSRLPGKQTAYTAWVAVIVSA